MVKADNPAEEIRPAREQGVEMVRPAMIARAEQLHRCPEDAPTAPIITDFVSYHRHGQPRNAKAAGFLCGTLTLERVAGRAGAPHRRRPREWHNVPISGNHAVRRTRPRRCTSICSPDQNDPVISRCCVCAVTRTASTLTTLPRATAARQARRAARRRGRASFRSAISRSRRSPGRRRVQGRRM